MAINLPILSSLNTTGFDKAKKEFASLSKTSDKAAFILKKSMVPALAALGGLATFGQKAAGAASDLNEEVSKSKQIFGGSAVQIEKFADTAAKTLGQSKTEALQAAASFGIMGKAAGLSGQELTSFSTDLVTLTGDLASFNNARPADVALALGAALRGESEPMRKFGVLLNDATLKAKAMAMGIYDGNGILKQQAKILAANAIIFDQTKVAQGDFARTSQGAANQQRILSATIKDATAKIGQGFLPILDAVLPILTKFADWAATNPAVFKNIAIAIGAVAIAIVGINIAMAANPFTLIAVGIGLAVAAVVGLYTKFQGFRDVVRVVVNAVINYFETMANNWIKAVNFIIRAANVVGGIFRAVGINIGKLSEIAEIKFGRISESTKQVTTSAAGFRMAEEKLSASTTKLSTDTAGLATETTKAGGAIEKTKSKIKDATKAAKDYADAVKDAVEVVKDQFSPALLKANDALTEAQDKYNEFYNSTKNVVSGIFNLGDAFKTAEENKAAFDKAIGTRTKAYERLGKLTEGTEEYADALEEVRQAEIDVETAQRPKRDFFEVIADQAAKAQELSKGIEDLIAAGLDDPELLRSILEAGGDTGLEIIKSILAGGKESIDRLAGLSKTVGDAAARIATLTADKWFKSGVDQATKIVEGINSVISATEFELKFVTTVEGAQAAGATFEQNVATVIGGGTPETLSNPFGGILGSINATPNTIYQGNAGAVSSQSVNINVNGGDPNAVVSALRSYMRTNGSVPIKISNAY